jgi:hypothetical protein
MREREAVSRVGEDPIAAFGRHLLSSSGNDILATVNTMEYRTFVEIREEFRTLVSDMSLSAPWLRELQEALRIECGYDDYLIETPIVFNGELDEIGPGSDIRFIVVADNPGKKEQLAANRRYLVGQSGKLAAGWFSRELGLNFRTQVMILNKTPVHTPKTAELRRLLALSGLRREELAGLLETSQVAMAGLAFRLQACIGCPLWISGYGELGKKGLFNAYAQELTRLFAEAREEHRPSLWLFRHFSMNQFAIEMKQKTIRGEGAQMEDWLSSELSRIGTENRMRILGF